MFKAIVQRFSQKLKQFINSKQPAFRAMGELLPQSAESMTCTSLSKSSVLEQQINTVRAGYQKDPARYLTSYLTELKSYINDLVDADSDQVIDYRQELLSVYEGLPEKLLEKYSLDYADALMDYALCLGDVCGEIKYEYQAIQHYQQLDTKDLELYNSFYLTALDCFINSLDQVENIERIVETSREMLYISKMAKQQSNNIQRQLEYLYCLDNYLRLLSQINEKVESDQNIIICYQEALTLYQIFCKQGRGYERLYVEMIERYNQFLIRKKQYLLAIKYNNQVIEYCLTSYQQDPEDFTGYLYRKTLEQQVLSLDKVNQPLLAENTFSQAVTLFAEMAEQEPIEVNKENYAYALTQCTKYLAQSGQIEQAISYSRKSVEIYIELLSQSAHYELVSEKALIQYQVLTGQI